MIWKDIHTRTLFSTFSSMDSVYLPMTIQCMPSALQQCLDLGNVSKSSNCNLLKTRQQAQNGVAFAKPHVTKPRFNYSFSSSKNGSLSWSVRNARISMSGVICLIDPCHPLKESNFAITNPLFLHSSHSLLPVKVFRFVQLFRVPFHPFQIECCTIQTDFHSNSLNLQYASVYLLTVSEKRIEGYANCPQEQ